MEDILRMCIVDILAYLESGNQINPTSVLHDQLKENSKHIISDDDIVNRMEEIVDDGAYNLDFVSPLFQKAYGDRVN